MGPDLVQFAAHPDHFHPHPGGQGKAAAGPEQRQHGQDHGGAGHGDRGLRYPVLRASAAQLSAQSDGDPLVQGRRQGSRRRIDGLPQRYLAGCLPDGRGAIAGLRRRRHERLRQRQGRCGVLPRRPLQDELPVQYRLRRSLEAVQEEPALVVRGCLHARLIRGRESGRSASTAAAAARSAPVARSPG